MVWSEMQEKSLVENAVIIFSLFLIGNFGPNANPIGNFGPNHLMQFENFNIPPQI